MIVATTLSMGILRNYLMININMLVVDKYIEYVLENINKIPIDVLLPWAENLPQELSLKVYIN